MNDKKLDSWGVMFASFDILVTILVIVAYRNVGVPLLPSILAGIMWPVFFAARLAEFIVMGGM